jgi:hypothetical protein
MYFLLMQNVGSHIPGLYTSADGVEPFFGIAEIRSKRWHEQRAAQRAAEKETSPPVTRSQTIRHGK